VVLGRCLSSSHNSVASRLVVNLKKPRFVGDGVLGSLISPPHPRSNPHLKTTNPKQHTKPSLLLVWLFCLCRACLLVFASWIKRQIPANKLRTPKAKPRQRGPLWVAFLCLWLVVVVCGGGWGFCFVAFARRDSIAIRTADATGTGSQAVKRRAISSSIQHEVRGRGYNRYRSILPSSTSSPTQPNRS
jgi:hypothetical protein